MSKAPNSIQTRLRILCDTLVDLEDFARLYDVSEHPTPSQYAATFGVSLTAACYVFDQLERKGLIVRSGRKEMDLTDAGAALLYERSTEVLSDVEKLFKLSEEKMSQMRKTSVELRMRLSKIVRGDEISVRDAVDLEDGGYVKRLPGRKVVLTEKGESVLRRGSRGPLPGAGNRTTMVVLPK